MVPVRGRGFDEPAVRVACRIAAPDKAQVLLLRVLEVARSLPLDSPMEAELGAAEEELAGLEEAAKRLGVKVETSVLQAREAGPAIIEEALRWDADLLVAALPVHSDFGDFSLGLTGQQLLAGAPCRLVLIRGPLEQREVQRSLPD